jgi:hypothetical protein
VRAFNIGHHDHSAGFERINVLNGVAQSLGRPVVVPSGTWLLNTNLLRQGLDLLISGKHGESFVVRD